MHTRTITAAITAVLAITLVGCAEESVNGSSTTANDKATATASELTPEVRESIRAAAGLPPSPAPVARNAYINGLNAIDPDIVHGKDDKAVSRGINACSTIKNFPGDEAKQIKGAGQRFTSPTHPEGRDTATAEKILALAHKHICPDF